MRLSTNSSTNSSIRSWREVYEKLHNKKVNIDKSVNNSKMNIVTPKENNSLAKKEYISHKNGWLQSKSIK